MLYNICIQVVYKQAEPEHISVLEIVCFIFFLVRTIEMRVVSNVQHELKPVCHAVLPMYQQHTKSN